MNNWLWIVGLILQTVLLGVLLRSGLVRKLPLFTSLMAFYVGRAVFLHFGADLMEDDAFSMCQQGLSLIDLIFQIGVAWELMSGGRSERAERTQGRHRGRQVMWFGAMVAASAALAWAVSTISPIKLYAHFDRGVILTSLLMLMVAAWALPKMREPGRAAAGRVLIGYTPLAATAIASQIGVAIAASTRNKHAYFGWSYATAIVYLAVLVFWLAAIIRNSARPLKKTRDAAVSAA